MKVNLQPVSPRRAQQLLPPAILFAFATAITGPISAAPGTVGFPPRLRI
jgi:hypothetical protein